MSRRSKFQAFIAFLLAVMLYLFFEITKHQPTLAQVNAFAEDPSDAVGSFGVQFALFTALLALVRAFRPYRAKAAATQELLLTRSIALTWIAVSVVLVADIIATIRYPALWLGSSAGYILTALLAGMVVLTAFVAWFSHRSTRITRAPITRMSWIKAGGVFGASILILAFYPESWRQSISGALLTALTGTILFFAAVWAWDSMTAPALTAFFEDFIDDLTSIYRWFKSRMSYLKPLFVGIEKVRHWSIVRWLNPRRHPWHGMILSGILLGLLLAFAEVTGEGGADPHQLGRLLAISAVFVGLECAGVLLGYVLLARPLGLFRREPASQTEASFKG